MLMHEEKRSVQHSGLKGVKRFRIAASSKAFRVLSSSLYSNKPLAIIRELSCNALDAHVSAGQKQPFEIKLPNAIDPTFYVKDYGTGLSQEQIEELYTTYFESDKTDSDDFVGGLGLGSKSPFSYVDRFTVESRYKGVKSLYSAFLDSERCPTIALASQEKTNEPNGMTITFAVRPDDFTLFSTACKRALMYFKEMPKVTGGGVGWDRFPIIHPVNGTGWWLRESPQFTINGAQVVQGPVPYPIDTYQLEQHGVSDEALLIAGMNIDIFVPIGHVGIAPSREALEYTPKTIANLKAMLEVATKEMRASVQDGFDACKNLWEVGRLFAKLMHQSTKGYQLYNKLHSAEPFLYKGKPIDGEVSLDLSDIEVTKLSLVETMRAGRRRRITKLSEKGAWDATNVTKEYSVKIHHNTIVLVNDINSPKSLLKYMDLAASDKVAFVIGCINKKMYRQDEVDDIIKQLGVDPNEVIVLSKTPYGHTETRKYGRSAGDGEKTYYRPKRLGEVSVWQGYATNGGWRRDELNRTYSRLCWMTETIELDDEGGYYVPLQRFTAMHKGAEINYMDAILECAVGLEILPKGFKLYGLNEKQAEAVKDDEDWINLMDFLEERMDDLNTDDYLINRIMIERVLANIGDGGKHLLNSWKTIEPQLAKCELKDFFNKLVTTNRECAPYPSNTIVKACGHIMKGKDHFGEEYIDKKKTYLLTVFKDTMNDYGLLRHLDWSSLTPTTLQPVVDYINAVAKGKI